VIKSNLEDIHNEFTNTESWLIIQEMNDILRRFVVESRELNIKPPKRFRKS
jgi:hypothetical protein